MPSVSRLPALASPVSSRVMDCCSGTGPQPQKLSLLPPCSFPAWEPMRGLDREAGKALHNQNRSKSILVLLHFEHGRTT